MTMYQSLLIALVSLPFCTQKLGPEEVSVTASLSTQIFDEIEVLLQGSE